MSVNITKNLMQVENPLGDQDDSLSATLLTTPLTTDFNADNSLPTWPIHRSYHSDANVIIQKWRYLFGQLLRFCLVGGLNTALDLLIFNAMFWFLPTQLPLQLLLYNSIAYALGGINSFLLNKYWTFKQSRRIGRSEVVRFSITTLLGIGVNDAILWLCSNLIHLRDVNPTLWANTSKLVAIFGTCLISYVGMRMWVFAHRKQN